MGDPEPKLHVNSAPALTTSALVGQTTRPFKLKVSLPGTTLPSPWVCRMTGSALAYQNYVGLTGTPRIFTWYRHRNGLDYLQDQEGNWLSWETTANCLYMSYWGYAAAWKLEEGRLIRVSDGAVLSYKTPQHWPLSTDNFLMALPSSEFALNVELVEEEPKPVERLLDKMRPVFAKRHAAGGTGDVERYLFSPSPAPVTATRAGESVSNPHVNNYDKGDLAFFGLTGAAPSEQTVPVYVLRRYAQDEGHTYFKLSLQTEEAGYAVDKLAKNQGPHFYAFASSPEREYLGQVYEHAAETHTPGLKRYFYDFQPTAHDGWSAGTPVFRALTPQVGQGALIEHLNSRSARAYAEAWFRENGEAFVRLFQNKGKEDLDRKFVKEIEQHFKELPQMKYVTLGAGGHLGYGLGTAGFEGGSIWRSEEFGYVPMHTPISDYTLEWVTFGGATGVDLGASADALAFGFWFGDTSQIEGGCNGITFSGQFVAGIAVTLLWDGTWQGAQYTSHPIGVTVVGSVGIEAGLGVFYNASATQFINRRDTFPHD